jgi:hypothetical protein
MQFMPAAIFDPVKDLPHPLLQTDEHSDFTRNFREMQIRARRPYSLTRVLRAYCKTPPRLDGFEQEVHEELSSLNRARNPVGKLVPIQALSKLRRDLSIAGYPQIVQTTVGDAIIPFLRAKTICGRYKDFPATARSQVDRPPKTSHRRHSDFFSRGQSFRSP